jgi:putative protease
MKSKTIELLAPAGTWEAMEAAINAGADAVYFSGVSFGARQYAVNFGEDEMKRAVFFAHMHRVRLYVTVNTLVDNSEKKELADYLIFLNNIGIDGIIVQDMGVINLAKKIVPELPLHASTQMTVTNSEGVNFAERNGMERAVLARECSLSEIKDICENTNIEIEAFIHGALCICYSGQCLMSSLIGGRSGNRGRCAQPCRLGYSLVNKDDKDVLDGKEVGKYLLSPKDMNTLDILPELIDTGITSYKIEGRMKRPEYVAVVVDTYRRAIDSYEAGKFEVSEQDRINIKQIFNRDFTTAYLEKRNGKNMMSDKRPNNRGVLIARIASFVKGTNRAIVKLEKDIHLNDGLEFWVSVGGRVGTTVTELKLNGKDVEAANIGDMVEINVPKGVRINDRIFRTFDEELMSYARNFYGEDNKKRIPVTAFVEARLGEKMQVTLIDDEGNFGVGSTKFIVETARKHPLTEEKLLQQMDRLGTSEYKLADLQFASDDNIIVPISEINEARRLAVEALNNERLNKFELKRNKSWLKKDDLKTRYNSNHPHNSDVTVMVNSVSDAKEAFSGGADLVILAGDTYNQKFVGIKEFLETAKIAREYGKKWAIATSRIIKEGQLKYFERFLKAVETAKPDLLYVSNNGLFEMAKKMNLSVPLWVDMSLNIYNEESLEFWYQEGAVGATLSPELTMKQVEELAHMSPLTLECLVQGRIEMMISEYCIAGSFLGNLDKGACTYKCREELFLKDRKNEKFPLKTDQFCRMHIVNAHDLSMLTHIKHMESIGIQRLKIDARCYENSEINNIVRMYKQVLNGDIVMEENLPKTTRGHYFRGVI